MLCGECESGTRESVCALSSLDGILIWVQCHYVSQLSYVHVSSLRTLYSVQSKKEDTEHILLRWLERWGPLAVSKRIQALKSGARVTGGQLRTRSGVDMVRVLVWCGCVSLLFYSHGSSHGTAHVAKMSNRDHRAHNMKPVLLKRSPLPAHAVGTAVEPASQQRKDGRAPKTTEISRQRQAATVHGFLFGRD